MTTNKKSPQAHSSTIVEPLVSALVETFSDLITMFIEILVKQLTTFLSFEKKQKGVISEKDLLNKKTTEDLSMIGYSVNSGRDIAYSEIELARHNLIVGGTGFGKSNLFSGLMENSLRNNYPFVSFDPKGSKSNINEFKSLCSFYNFKHYVFSEIENSGIRFNPLKGLTPTQGAQILMRSFEWGDGDSIYYKNLSKMHLLKCLSELIKEGDTPSLHSVYDYILSLPKKDQAGLLGLTSQLAEIILSPFGRLFDDRDGRAISLKDVKEEGICVYIGLSTQGYGSTARTIGKLFINDLQQASHSVGISVDDAHFAINRPIDVFVDEGASILYKDFIDFLNKTRSSGFRVYIAVQSIADLESIGKEFAHQIKELCSNWFILKQGVNQYASELSQTIGTYLTKKKTSVIIHGAEGDKGSVRESREFFVNPQVIKELNVGQCVVFTKAPNAINLVNLRDIRKSDAFSYNLKKTPLDRYVKEKEAELKHSKLIYLAKHNLINEFVELKKHKSEEIINEADSILEGDEETETLASNDEQEHIKEFSE